MIQKTTQFSSAQLSGMGQAHMARGFTKIQQDKINKDLRKLGVVRYDFWLPETHVLPYIIQTDEEIKGIVFGRYEQTGNAKAEGRGALIATNHRILLVDKKPLFLKCDELTYGIVTGVSYTKISLGITVTLHTRVGEIHVRTLNQRCASTFIDAIETDYIAKNEQGIMADNLSL